MGLSLWEFFFKYSPVVYESGRIVLGTPLSVWLLAVAVVVAAAAAYSYFRRTSGLSRRDRGVLIAFRVALLSLLLLLLLRPILQVPVAVDQENYLGILVDDSRSMLVADDGTTTRAESLAEQLDDELIQSLSERYRLRLFGFSGDANRITDFGEMTFRGGRTQLGRALDQAQSELAGVPVAGLVMVTDGADQSEADLNRTLLSLRSSGVPVYTVGVGEESFEQDIEIRRVSAPRSVLRGTSMMVEVQIAQNGYAGQTIPLIVEDEGRVVNSQDVEMPVDGAPASVQVHFTADQGGWRRFRFRVPVQDGELIPENNERQTLIDVREGRQKILYLEGEPRFEVKFMRRAVADDEELQLVVLQRTAENKFLRLDVDDGDELANGFPTTREELFTYRALIIGSVEASFFSREQIQMLTEFVADRGGSILFLGGKRSFAEGGWAGTRIADLMPVEMEGGSEPDYYREVTVQPTRAGLAHAALRLNSDPDSSAAIWAGLPALSTFNRLTRLKPGATALLTGTGPGVSEGQVILAWQRYGRGLSLALPVQDTWIWQMHADIPLEDQTHETLWRQLSRWLVNGVPDQFSVTASVDAATVDQAVQLTADVRDDTFQPLNDASVTADVERPDGSSVELVLRPTNRVPGEYTASYTPEGIGIHQIRLLAQRGEEEIARAGVALEAVADDGEFYEAQMRAPLLRRIAEETGGRFYPLSEMSRLAEDVQYSGSGITRVERYDLWDMPFVFFLLVGLIGGEWAFRRRQGLP